MNNLSFVTKVLLVIASFIFCNNTNTFSQTLYEDAMKIADDIENQSSPVFTLSSKSNVKIAYTKAEGGKAKTVVRWVVSTKGLAQPKTNRINLDKQGIYSIEISEASPDNIGFITYGKENDRIDFSCNLVTRFNILNEVDQISVVQMDTSKRMTFTNNVNSIIKKELIEIYGLLGKHTEVLNKKNPNEELTSYQLAQKFNFINDNSFLAPWLAERKLTDLSLKSMEKTTPIIRESIVTNSQIDLSPENILHGDKRKRKFKTLKELQLNYREEPLESSQKLKQISSQIQVQEQKISNPLNAASLAAGLSDFVVERAQEEFNVAFMDGMREKLRSEKYSEFRALFPKSQAFFQKDIDIVNYKNILPLARQSFLMDIENVHHNLHNLFNLEKYADLKNAPSIYNLVLFYEMIDLVYQEVPLDTIMPVAYNMLLDREKEFDQKINFVLANDLLNKNTELLGLRSEIIDVNKSIESLAKSIEGDVFTLELKMNDLYEKFDSNSNETIKKMAKSLLDFQRKYIVKTDPMNDRLFDFMGSFSLGEINANLEGLPNYDRLLDNPTVESYPSLFQIDKTYDAKTLIAAGLDKSKSFYNMTNSDQAVVPFLSDYRKYLLDTDVYLNHLDSIYSAFQKQNDFPKRIKDFNDSLEKLFTDLKSENSKLMANGSVPLEDIKAIEFLEKTIPTAKQIKRRLILIKRAKRTPNAVVPNHLELYLPKDASLEKIESEESRKEKLKGFIIERLAKIEKNSKTSPQPYSSDLLEKLTKKQTTEPSVYEKKLAELKVIQANANALSKKIKSFEAKESPILSKARVNSQRLSHLMEITTELLYCFRISPDSIRNPENKKYITKGMYKELMSNPLRRDIYMGLVYERLKNTGNFDNISSSGVASLTTSLMGNIQVIAEQRDTLALTPDPNFNDYYPIIKAGIGMINGLIETPLYNNISLANSSDSTIFKYIPDVSRNVLSLFENIHDKEYGIAIYNALEVFKIFAFEQEMAQFSSDSVLYQIAVDNNQDVKATILKYGTFMANVASAKNAEDVKNALKAAALPPGSSRIKRENESNISINSYLFFSAGADILTNDNIGKNAWDRTGVTTGLSLPVGVSFSWRFKQLRKFPSYTLFVSVLDVGAVTAFRIDQNNNSNANYNTDFLPDLEFSNLIAPGAFLYLNAPRSPFSFGIGAQYGPQLRKITIDGNPDITSSASWRFLFNIGIDVPIFNLSTGSKGEAMSRKERKKRRKAIKAFKREKEKQSNN